MAAIDGSPFRHVLSANGTGEITCSNQHEVSDEERKHLAFIDKNFLPFVVRLSRKMVNGTLIDSSSYAQQKLSSL